MKWYPLKLTFHVRTYPYGERLIADYLGKRGLPDGVVAETWQISDYRDTSGTVVNGELTGQRFHDLVMTYPDELVGEGWRGPHFPLLQKFLDASHMLPVHMHADDAIAQSQFHEPNGKTEAWHILWAAPEASILVGIKPGFSRDELFAAMRSQEYDTVMPRFPIHAGDTVYVPGAVLHTFGPDTLIFEVQQTSDITLSVMPTDPYGRSLDTATWEQHITSTLDNLRTHYQPWPHPGLDRVRGANRLVVGCAGPRFVLERWTLVEPHRERAHPRRCLSLSNVGSTGVIIRFDGGQETLARAESCVLPAAIGGLEVVPDGQASLVACYVPDLQLDVVEPLLALGYSADQICSLGEVDV